jgi:hypothetical protein
VRYKLLATMTLVSCVYINENSTVVAEQQIYAQYSCRVKYFLQDTLSRSNRSDLAVGWFFIQCMVPNWVTYEYLDESVTFTPSLCSSPLVHTVDCRKTS